MVVMMNLTECVRVVMRRGADTLPSAISTVVTDASLTTDEVVLGIPGTGVTVLAEEPCVALVASVTHEVLLARTYVSRLQLLVICRVYAVNSLTHTIEVAFLGTVVYDD